MTSDVLAALPTVPPGVQVGMIEFLMRAGDKGSLPALRLLAASEDAAVRWFALMGRRNLGDFATMDPWLQALSDPDPDMVIEGHSASAIRGPANSSLVSNGCSPRRTGPSAPRRCSRLRTCPGKSWPGPRGSGRRGPTI
ncbi:MAG: HEAT repeat domain-containing protein [Deltaproteobacteria bacterium]|nr:HEAT repeat domain-containing protein [Deltaproteobacteria bacterium]